MCPMRFNKFPLDEHSCKFLVGSTNYDDKRMTFSNKKLEYDPSAGNTILDYQVSQMSAVLMMPLVASFVSRRLK